MTWHCVYCDEKLDGKDDPKRCCPKRVAAMEQQPATVADVRRIVREELERTRGDE